MLRIKLYRLGIIRDSQIKFSDAIVRSSPIKIEIWIIEVEFYRFRIVL